MNKNRLLVILIAGIVLFNGCVYKQIPYSKYNEDKVLAKGSPEYQEYFLAVKKRIYDFAYKNYNVLEVGQVYFYLTILNDGTIKNIEVDKSKTKASENLINVAVKAVSGASPFSPFPKDLSQNSRINKRVNSPQLIPP